MQKERLNMCVDEINIPTEMSYEALKVRKRIIKEFYYSWNERNPDKQVWNNSLGVYIKVKFSSINETVDKAALRPESTKAVFNLDKILAQAKFVKVHKVKTNNRNQKQFLRMLEMRYENIKLMVGHQKNGDYVQYSITVID